MQRSSNLYNWSQPTYSVPTYPTSSPGPMPSTPHLHTVSLPHPNSAPHYASSSQYSYHDQGTPGILALNPLLSASGAGIPMYYNVTRDVQYIRLRPECPQNSLDAPAVHPSCPHLVLSVPSLPLWPTIEVRNPGGVTVRDVLVRIRDVLNRGVSPAEMGSVGMKRMDFLGHNVVFAGLSRSMDGRDRWEVRFVPRM